MTSRDIDWIVPATVVVIAAHISSAAFAAYLGVPPQTAYLRRADSIGLVIALAAGGAFLWQLWRCFQAGDPTPGRTITARIKQNRLHLAVFSFGMLMLGAKLAAFSRIKEMLSLPSGFWADPLLASMDRSIFGADPWTLLHFIEVGPAIDQLYSTWFLANLIAFWAILATKPSEWKTNALTAYFLMWCMGAVLQYLLPAAGPIFYERVGHGAEFAALPIEAAAGASADFLWLKHHASGGEVGSGISAWPSMHVAGTTWIALSARGAWRHLAIIYALLIWFGSVYLGWHYAVDGIAGCALALFAWKVAVSIRSARLAVARQSSVAL